MSQSQIDLLIAIFLPLVPAALAFLLAYYLVPGKTQVDGFFGRVKIKASGPIAAYFAALAAVGAFQALDAPRQRDYFQQLVQSKDLEINIQKGELTKLRGEKTALESNHAAEVLAGLTTRIETLEKEKAALTNQLQIANQTGNPTAEVWTVKGRIKLKQSAELAAVDPTDEADVRDIQIVLVPPPRIENDGGFQLKVVKTMVDGTSDFPTLKFVKPGYHQPHVRLNADDAKLMGVDYHVSCHDQHHEMVVTEPVVLTYTPTYDPPMNRGAIPNQGASH